MKSLSILMIGIFAFPLMTLAQEGYPPECRLVTTHKPSADVAYQPGVDVKGRPVVSADLNTAPMDMGRQSVIVPLTIDMAERLRGRNIAGLNLEGTLGFLEVQPTGKILYNGQDLTRDVTSLCDEKPSEAMPAANGQAPPDAVEYAPVKENEPMTEE